MIQIMLIRYLIIFVSGNTSRSCILFWIVLGAFTSWSPVRPSTRMSISLHGLCSELVPGDYIYTLRSRPTPPLMGLILSGFDQHLSRGILNGIYRGGRASCRSIAPSSSWQIEASKRQQHDVGKCRAWNLLPRVTATEHCDEKPVRPTRMRWERLGSLSLIFDQEKV